ncbi:MAG: hypothetical protein WC516_06520 [Patescibacteria group bacterium]|jgi:hypothetical protein
MIQMEVVPEDSGLSELISGLEMVSRKFLPNTTRAVKVCLAVMQYTWKCYASGTVIDGTSLKIKTISGAYLRSIKTKHNNLGGVVYSDSPYAASIEDDQESKDLKKIIPFGKKSRITKDNLPYAIVPFRHGVPTSLSAPMPEIMYKMIRQKFEHEAYIKSSVRMETYTSPNAMGKEVKRHTYNWGSRIKQGGKNKSPLFPDLEGMVVFNVSGGSTKERSEYVTFRIITAYKPIKSKSKKGWANSWVVPSRKGYHLTRWVVTNTRDIVAGILKAGITKDLTG